LANFKTHVLFGTIFGIIFAISIYLLNFVTNFIILLAAGFISFVGSFLPDIDSDTGSTFTIIFTLFSIFIGILTFFILIRIPNVQFYLKIILSFVSSLLFYIIGGGIFKKFTRHRGIIHSIPVAIIFLFSFLFVSRFFGINDFERIFLSLSLFIGFISHLVLDEIYSTKNFLGITYGVKKSFGSALKFNSKSFSVSIIAYSLIIILILVNYRILEQILKKILN